MKLYYYAYNYILPSKKLPSWGDGQLEIVNTEYVIDGFLLETDYGVYLLSEGDITASRRNIEKFKYDVQNLTGFQYLEIVELE